MRHLLLPIKGVGARWVAGEHGVEPGGTAVGGTHDGMVMVASGITGTLPGGRG